MGFDCFLTWVFFSDSLMSHHMCTPSSVFRFFKSETKGKRRVNSLGPLTMSVCFHWLFINRMLKTILGKPLITGVSELHNSREFCSQNEVVEYNAELPVLFPVVVFFPVPELFTSPGSPHYSCLSPSSVLLTLHFHTTNPSKI